MTRSHTQSESVRHIKVRNTLVQQLTFVTCCHSYTARGFTDNSKLISDTNSARRSVSPEERSLWAFNNFDVGNIKITHAANVTADRDFVEVSTDAVVCTRAESTCTDPANGQYSLRCSIRTPR